ncbi:AAA family ATPase [uncultured Alistipes sp.]|uniref:AAA family ATPase n=1 Tax=uncultured Alistipes sp. TaxID=538949 RepID=UPI00266EE3AC|nr:AAA family ATPase [uncultured Alistipes sp.]
MVSNKTTSQHTVQDNVSDKHRRLIFNNDEDNCVIVEGSEKREESMFRAQYDLAHDIFRELSADKSKDLRKTNNIIAFCGDRGSGKTSCMESFRQQLKPDQDANCLFLETIDPSFFDDSNNILGLVLGQMYNVLVKDERKRDRPYRSDKDDFAREQLLEEFNTAMRYMKHLAKASNREKFYDALEELDALAAGLQLRETLRHLFESYLAYLGKKLLVITIDDLDLNIRGAYVMSEFIRKYLTDEQCLILLSVKVDQLVEAIKINLRQEQHISDEESYRMAVKYVVKLIPAGNRVNMPELENYCDNALEYRKGGQTSEYRSVKEAITRIIFWKTGYLFYNSKGRSSLIVPRNLRSLRQLLHLLAAMEDHDKQNSTAHHANQQIFKNYFFRTWTQQLNQEYQERIDKILANDNNLHFNKTVVAQLSTLPEFDKMKKFEKLFDSSNYAYNISLGDVMNLLEYLSQNETDTQLQMFQFFIRSLYSIKLYEAYDRITENIGAELFPDKKEAGIGEIYASDALFDRTNVLQQLVNGAYFSYEADSILPPNKSENKSRDLRLINGSTLEKELQDLGTKRDTVDEEYKRRFRLIEFFMLCTSRHIALKKKDESWSSKWSSSVPGHILGFTQGTKNLIFDVMAPFYNILNLRMTYDRFDGFFRKRSQDDQSLYDFARNQEWTLLNSMYDTSDRAYPVPEHSFMSDAVIRNSEVLTAMNERLKAQRHVSRSSSNSKCIAEFYRSIINSEMNTYPRMQNENPHTIEFKFLSAIIEILDSADMNRFNTIFSQNETPETEQEEEQMKRMLKEVFRGGSYKLPTIRQYLQEKLDDIYQKQTPEQWDMTFPSDTLFKQSDVIRIITEIATSN